MSSIATDPNLAANVSSTTDSNDSTTYITLESLMEELPAFPPFLGFGQNPNPPNSKLPDWTGVAECDLIFDSCSVENGCPSEDRPAVLTVEAGEYTPGHPSIVEYLHSYISSVKGLSLEPRIQQNPIVTRLQAPPPKPDKDNLLVDSDLTASGLHLPFNELQNPEQADPRVIRLFHKLWLQLAARNLTFGIFTNYNQTVFLLRHRCSNTLYISRLITILEKELIVAFACLLRAAIDDHRATQRQQTCGKWDFREELLQTEERNENILLVAGNQNKVEPGCKGRTIASGHDFIPGDKLTNPDQFPSIKAPAEFPTGFFGTYVDPDVDG
ncbi:hypothetical protein FRC03_001657 [Tulasnella sp. 419]|nr:hypothetical protein FRC03_001657 [Tulasnella sp. 419]